MELQGVFQGGMPFVSVRVAGKEFRALMDTGYDGFVMLSSAEIKRLDLKELGKSVYRTADGRLHEGKIHVGRVEWLGSAGHGACQANLAAFHGRVELSLEQRSLLSD